MGERKVKGQIVSGKFDDILIRIKDKEHVQLGELLVVNSNYSVDILQVFDIEYSSQISQQNLELSSGLFLERDSTIQFLDDELRNYKVAHAKILFKINNYDFKVPKTLPDFFSYVYELSNEDLNFFNMTRDSIFLGKIRSGDKVLDINVGIPTDKILSEHVLVCASTGKGKSNLTSCILFDSIDKNCAFLILDPHDEYYGRNSIGLKDHPLAKDLVSYYTPQNVPPGQNTLRINISSIRPGHFRGALNLSDPQVQLMYSYYRDFKEKWIEYLLLGETLKSQQMNSFNDGTINVLKRKIQYLLNMSVVGDNLVSSGIFVFNSSESAIKDLVLLLESGKSVVIDTSSLSGSAEILIGSIITSEIFSKHKELKMSGKLDDAPNISVVLEEAPRVLGKDIIESGGNIFETLAREGRKFKVGLFAITQLPSLIPKPILANLNTKIILGLEMGNERQAIIESASQDLSRDSRTIASLDKGEAIISSTFLKFPVPVKIPKFHDYVTSVRSKFNKEHAETKKIKLDL
ncbi:ATP-binding protein [Candidatus Woesearchaeota archaeon]|nr:ATP-binding protein [Candidatus Woesearchaeota archaeon]